MDLSVTHPLQLTLISPSPLTPSIHSFLVDSFLSHPSQHIILSQSSNSFIYLSFVDSSVTQPSHLTPISNCFHIPASIPSLCIHPSHSSQHTPIFPSPLKLIHPPLPHGFIHLSSIPACAHLSISFTPLHPSLLCGFVHHSTIPAHIRLSTSSQTTQSIISLWIHPSLIHPSTCSPLYLLTHPFIPSSCTHPSTHLSLHFLSNSSIHPFLMDSSINPPSSHPSLHLLPHPCIHPFCIHLIHPRTCPSLHLLSNSSICPTLPYGFITQPSRLTSISPSPLTPLHPSLS